LIGGLSYLGAVVAAGAIVGSGGTLAAAIVGAAMAGGTGGVIGALLAGILDEEHALRVEKQLDRGGLLLWVHVRDDDHEQRALRILRRHSGQDVHIHDIAASA
jgi:outer membrane lipoprotein SlyB